MKPPPAPDTPAAHREKKADEQLHGSPSLEPPFEEPASHESAPSPPLPSSATSEAAGAPQSVLEHQCADPGISGPPARRQQPPRRPQLPSESPTQDKLAPQNSDPMPPSDPTKDVREEVERAEDGPASSTTRLRPKEHSAGDQKERAPQPAAAPSRGVEADRGKRSVARYLSGSIAFVACFGMAPAVMEVIDHLRFIDQSPGVSRWAMVVFLLGALQLAYAFYLVQLPDWSTVWVVTLATLVLAALYAMMLGMALAGEADSDLLVTLQLSRKLAGGKLAGWCLIMFSLSGLLAYFSGRASVAWHRSWAAMAAAQSTGC